MDVPVSELPGVSLRQERHLRGRSALPEEPGEALRSLAVPHERRAGPDPQVNRDNHPGLEQGDGLHRLPLPHGHGNGVGCHREQGQLGMKPLGDLPHEGAAEGVSCEVDRSPLALQDKARRHRQMERRDRGDTKATDFQALPPLEAQDVPPS